MRCNNCGKDVVSGAKFCDGCGAPIKAERMSFCSSCGEMMKPDEDFCGHCGARAVRKRVVAAPKKPVKKRKSPWGTIILILILILLLMAGIMAGYMFYPAEEGGIGESATQSPAVQITAEPVATQAAVTLPPVPTARPTVQPIPERKEYPQISDKLPSGEVIYTSRTDGFTARIPADFEIISCNDTAVSCVSPDNEGMIEIQRMTDSGMSVKNMMNSYINSKGGRAEYQSVGDSYFAARIADGGDYDYRYCKFANGKIYVLSVRFPGSQFNKYDGIINDIYESIVAQF